MLQYAYVLVLAIAVGSDVAQAAPRARREAHVELYCARHQAHYSKYCTEKHSDLDSAAYTKLAKFCPAFEKHCSTGKTESVPIESTGPAFELILPPPLPKTGSESLSALDLPIGSQHKTTDSLSISSATRLTAAIIASCTPDCTAAHCTDECKCANTHPKVHAMCNPPANSAMAATCKRWYDKCTMFNPLSYY